jgi:tol-pal system protein YbgF
MERQSANVDSLLDEQRQLTLNQRAMLMQQIQTQNEQLSMIGARQDEINVLLHDILSQLEAIQLYGGPRPTGLAPADTSQVLQTATPVRENPPARPASVSSATQSSAAAQPSSSPTESSAPAASPGLNVRPEDLFKAGMDDMNNGSYALAESRFLTFLIQFPTHELGESAQYWLGEAAAGQNKTDVAIQEFDKFLKKFPKSTLAAAAMLKKGQVQQQAGDTRSAGQTWQMLVKSYPGTDQAAQAQALLAQQGQ